MKMKTKSRKGFTLTELLVGIIASAIIIFATGIIIVRGQTFWNEAWKKVNLQRDASYAMLVMSQSIKSAADVKLEAGGKAIRVTDAAGNTTRFQLNNGQDTLQRQVVPGPPSAIVDDVQNLQFNVDDVNDTVTIDLGLQDGDVQTYFVSTVMIRN
ncbi:MAG: prepilin-type N-terminal cleavage/methylation domain-containing protein [Phycisphaerae bacterium]|nr:prepilin-type N-terminal cleavage/methylation domain-containing protein [Phycisphaerae bacterium]MDD5380355.1 prepilin-type N-terminal cleavage/methylation domain-containing protein [Phycisphaerae bacterium]